MRIIYHLHVNVCIMVVFSVHKCTWSCLNLFLILSITIIPPTLHLVTCRSLTSSILCLRSVFQSLSDCRSAVKPHRNQLAYLGTYLALSLLRLTNCTLPFAADKLCTLPFAADKLCTLPFEADKLCTLPFEADKHCTLPFEAETLCMLPFDAFYQTKYIAF